MELVLQAEETTSCHKLVPILALSWQAACWCVYNSDRVWKARQIFLFCSSSEQWYNISALSACLCIVSHQTSLFRFLVLSLDTWHQLYHRCLIVNFPCQLDWGKWHTNIRRGIDFYVCEGASGSDETWIHELSKKYLHLLRGDSSIIQYGNGLDGEER